LSPQEFYAVVVNELVSNTIIGIIAVCAACFLFFPYWEAILFIFPVMLMLYVDLLGE
jgi:diacylglycerol kinase